MAALYMFIFTDIGDQGNVNDGIMPSSTIGSGVSGVKGLTSDQKNSEANLDDTNAADSLKNFPEVIDDSSIHLTGKKQK